MKKPKTWNFLTSLWWLMASSSKFLMMSSFLQHVTKLFSLVIFIFISLKICRKFIGEHPCRSTISIKLQSNFIVWHRVVVVITTAQFQPSRNSGSAQVRTCSQHVRDSRWWGSLTMVPAGNKTKCLSSVNHTTKTIHHHHHHHWIHSYELTINSLLSSPKLLPLILLFICLLFTFSL